MKLLKLLPMIFAALFVFIMIIASTSTDTETEPQEKEINYISKGKTATRMYILEELPDAKMPFISNEKGQLLENDDLVNFFPDIYKNYQYVSLKWGHYTLNNNEFEYETIVGIEKDNRSATYGVSGIDIIYFRVLD